jgi:uncharacterized iron-regulated membrane protein
MQPQQWFTLWMTLISTLGGGLVTLTGVVLAFRFNIINTVAQDERVREREGLGRLEAALLNAHRVLQLLPSQATNDEGKQAMMPVTAAMLRTALADLPPAGTSLAATTAATIRAAVDGMATDPRGASEKVRELDELIETKRRMVDEKLHEPGSAPSLLGRRGRPG